MTAFSERRGREHSFAALLGLGALLALVLLTGCGRSGTIVAPGIAGRERMLSTASASTTGASALCSRHMRLDVERKVDVGSGAGALAVDAGAVWVAREQAGTIARVTPTRQDVLSVGSSPVGLSVGFGKLWVALRDGDKIASVDLHTLAHRYVASVLTPSAVLAGAGRVWALSLDSSALYPINPSTGSVGELIYAPVSDPVEIALANHELWLLGAAEGGISPINANLQRMVRTGFDLPGRKLSGLSSDGATIWLGEPTRQALLRIDASSVNVTELPAPEGLHPTATATGRCGVWVAGGAGALDLVDARSGAAMAPAIHVGRSIAALASAGAGVWASDPVDGNVVYVGVRPAR